MSFNQYITSVEVLEVNDQRELSAVSPAVVLDLLAGPGAVLIRGFEVGTDTFESFTRQLCDSFHGSAARLDLRNLSGDGYTVQAPATNFNLLVHNEGSFQLFRPADLAFFMCQLAPESPGGETLLVDGRAFLKCMPRDLRQRFEEQGVIYEALWEPKRWRAELDVKDEGALAGLVKKYPGFNYQLENGKLRYRYHRSAIQPDSQGELVFTNAMLAHLPAVDHPNYQHSIVHVKDTNRVFFGNGQELDQHVINTLIDIQDSVAYAHPWQGCDLLVIDNTRVMHGRKSTEVECPRVVLTRFGYLGEGLRQR